MPVLHDVLFKLLFKSSVYNTCSFYLKVLYTILVTYVICLITEIKKNKEKILNFPTCAGIKCLFCAMS